MNNLNADERWTWKSLPQDLTDKCQQDKTLHFSAKSGNQSPFQF